MPGTDTNCGADQTPTRLHAALRWMPVQLLLMFVVLVALDLACQLLRSRLVHAVPAVLSDAAQLCGALVLAVAMIAAYRWLVRMLERRAAEELKRAGAGRALTLGALVGVALFVLVYVILWGMGAASFAGWGGLWDFRGRSRWRSSRLLVKRSYSAG
jgi:hypothetical protein